MTSVPAGQRGSSVATSARSNVSASSTPAAAAFWRAAVTRVGVDVGADDRRQRRLLGGDRAPPRPRRASGRQSAQRLGRQRRPALEAEPAAQAGRDPARRQRVLDRQRARPRHRIDERQVGARAAQRQHGRGQRLLQRRLDHRHAVAAPVQRLAREIQEQPRLAPPRRATTMPTSGDFVSTSGRAPYASRSASTTASLTFSAAKPECVSAGVSRTLPWTRQRARSVSQSRQRDGARAGVQRRRVGRVELGELHQHAHRDARAQADAPSPSSAAPRTRRRPGRPSRRRCASPRSRGAARPRCRGRR